MEKYLKYKKKYLLLKNQLGSGIYNHSDLKEYFKTFQEKDYVANIFYDHFENKSEIDLLISLIIGASKYRINYDKDTTTDRFVPVYNLDGTPDYIRGKDKTLILDNKYNEKFKKYLNFFSDHPIIHWTDENLLLITFNVEGVQNYKDRFLKNYNMFVENTNSYNFSKGIPTRVQPINMEEINDEDIRKIIKYKNNFICLKLQNIIDLNPNKKIIINIQECYPSIYIYLIKNLKVNGNNFKPTKLISDVIYESFNILENLTIKEMKKKSPRYWISSSFCTLVYDNTIEQPQIPIAVYNSPIEEPQIPIAVDDSTIYQSQLVKEALRIKELYELSIEIPDITEELIAKWFNDIILHNSKYYFLDAEPCNMYSIYNDRDTKYLNAGSYQVVCNGIFIKDYNIVNIHSKISHKIDNIKNLINSFTPLQEFIRIPDPKDLTRTLSGEIFKKFSEIDHTSHVHLDIDDKVNIIFKSHFDYVTDPFYICGDLNTPLQPHNLIIPEDIGCRTIEYLSNYHIDHIIKIGEYQ